METLHRHPQRSQIALKDEKGKAGANQEGGEEGRKEKNGREGGRTRGSEERREEGRKGTHHDGPRGTGDFSADVLSPPHDAFFFNSTM